MGQGAYVTIANCSFETLDVGYWGIECVYENGDDGSNFAPITNADFAPRNSMSSYIEAKASGTCFFASASTFNMSINVGNGGGNITFAFSEANTMWAVEGGSYSWKSEGTVGAMAAISNGSRDGSDVITVIIYGGDSE